MLFPLCCSTPLICEFEVSLSQLEACIHIKLIGTENGKHIQGVHKVCKLFNITGADPQKAPYDLSSSSLWSDIQ